MSREYIQLRDQLKTIDDTYRRLYGPKMMEAGFDSCHELDGADKQERCAFKKLTSLEEHVVKLCPGLNKFAGFVQMSNKTLFENYLSRDQLEDVVSKYMNNKKNPNICEFQWSYTDRSFAQNLQKYADACAAASSDKNHYLADVKMCTPAMKTIFRNQFKTEAYKELGLKDPFPPLKPLGPAPDRPVGGPVPIGEGPAPSKPPLKPLGPKPDRPVGGPVPIGEGPAPSKPVSLPYGWSGPHRRPDHQGGEIYYKDNINKTTSSVVPTFDSGCPNLFSKFSSAMTTSTKALIGRDLSEHEIQKLWINLQKKDDICNDTGMKQALNDPTVDTKLQEFLYTMCKQGQESTSRGDWFTIDECVQGSSFNIEKAYKTWKSQRYVRSTHCQPDGPDKPARCRPIGTWNNMSNTTKSNEWMEEELAKSVCDGDPNCKGIISGNGKNWRLSRFESQKFKANCKGHARDIGAKEGCWPPMIALDKRAFAAKESAASQRVYRKRRRTPRRRR